MIVLEPHTVINLKCKKNWKFLLILSIHAHCKPKLLTSLLELIETTKSIGKPS